MSKRSIDYRQLERDGLEQWLGTNRKEIAKRADDHMIAKSLDHSDEFHDDFHEGMFTEHALGRLPLPKGRPKLPAGQERPPTRVTLAAAEYRRRATQRKAERSLYGHADELISEIASEFGVSFYTLRNCIYRGKIHK